MLIAANNLSKSYGVTTVLNNISFVINDNDRVGIVGTNGVGKSTLLKILAGKELGDSGNVKYRPAIEIGYLQQVIPEFSGRTIDDLIFESVGNLRQLEGRMRELENLMTKLSGDQLNEILQEYGDVSAKFQERGGYELDYRIDVVLAGLGLNHLPRSRDVHSLSGGEKARIALATLLLGSPDLLLLDEPTNHLDIASLSWLETYLSQYRGGVAVVSHDRQFLNRAIKEIFEIDEYTHELRAYTGDYDAYKRAKERETKMGVGL
ncbi:MAG: ATP-binding cassette domain-containing protein [Anaerolineae bacterium]|nr:ATP-binding cassette domain-containing protein [Anaerolineae bacterium]